jgi:hypothetical protein
MLRGAPKHARVQTRRHGGALPKIASVPRGLKSGTALALRRAAALVTRSWDATTTPPHIGGRRTVPPDTSQTDTRLGPK